MPQAAAPIKSYSPELIVHGCLRAGSPSSEHKSQVEEVTKWFPALTALVVGPGLGRDSALQAVAALVIEKAVAAQLPCVIDADGLKVVLENPGLLRGSRWSVLTPNRPEYGRLLAALLPTHPPPPATLQPSTADLSKSASGGSVDTTEAMAVNELGRLCATLDGPVVVRKGPSDLICDGSTFLENCEPGSLKRCGDITIDLRAGNKK